jgi:predicted amidohydrolase
MKVSVAQIKVGRGDIAGNIERHKVFIKIAVAHGAEVIVFPELSVTGYEPELAETLAMSQDDERLDGFQDLADQHKLTIGVGMPTRAGNGIRISMIIFQPGQARSVYSKQFLHHSETPWFVAGDTPVTLSLDAHNKLSLAICYELSVPVHAETAFNSGASIYIASVLNSVSGVGKDLGLLSGIAAKYGMHVLMANYTGATGGYDCAGKASAWNKQGELLAQLNYQDEGLLILDTENDNVEAVGV